MKFKFQCLSFTFVRIQYTHFLRDCLWLISTRTAVLSSVPRDDIDTKPKVLASSIYKNKQTNKKLDDLALG